MLFELPEFAHINVNGVQEAASCLDHYGDKARVIAGATDLLGLMQDRIEGLRGYKISIQRSNWPDRGLR